VPYRFIATMSADIALRFEAALGSEKDPAVRAAALRTRDAILERAPIGDVYAPLVKLPLVWREPLASLVGEVYPIDPIVRLSPRVRDHVVLAALAWAVQRRVSARETFEAFIGFVDDGVLISALARLWAVTPEAQPIAVYASHLDVRGWKALSPSQLALAFLERWAPTHVVARLLTKTFDDDLVLRALLENGVGHETSVLWLRYVGWTPARIAAALSRTDLLAWEVRHLTG
jgi:hypothetical protein